MRMPLEDVIARLDSLLSREQFDEAKAFLYESLADARAENDLPGQISLYNEIMGFERQYGAPEAALSAADAALRLLDGAGMAVSKPAAMIVLNAATVYHRAGKNNEARALYDRAESLFGKYYPPGAPEFAGLYNNRAAVYLNPGEYEKAAYYYERALGVLRRYGDFCETAVTCLNLAGLCARLPGREDEAKTYAAAGVMSLERQPEAERGAYYYYTCRKCAAACAELGMAQEEQTLRERADRYYAGH